MPTTCPCCHRAMPKPRPVKATLTDLSTLPDTALFAHYKLTAPIEDLRFFLRCPSLSAEIRTDAAALLDVQIASPMPRPEFYRRLTALQDRWRHLANARERSARETAAA